MITRGSKFFFGAAIAAYVTALVYGFITGASIHGGVVAVLQDGDLIDSIIGPISFGWKGWVGEHVGYVTLMGFAGVSAVLGGFLVVFRDGGAESIVPLQGAEQKAETADLRVMVPQGLSPWPIVCAFAAGLIVVGLTFSTMTVLVGCVILAVAAFQWTVRAWSERLTVDPVQNAALRSKLMSPYNVPGAAILGIAVIMFLMSRILLALPSVGGVFVIIVSAAAVFGIAILLASRPDLKRSITIAVLVAGGLLLLLGGIAGGMAGTYKSGDHGSEEGAPAPSGFHSGVSIDRGDRAPVVPANNSAGLTGGY